MGVSELLHFRRIPHRGRKVADGSRHFVVGVDNTEDPTQPGYPKSPNFVVHYDKSDLSSAELDTCNNNSILNSHRITNTPPSPSNSASVIITSVIPGSEQASSGSTGGNDREATNNAPAVLGAMELEEVQLFSQSAREEMMTDE